MTQMTVDEARDALVEATAKYRDVEAALAQSVAGESTPDRVLRQVELQGDLVQAAGILIQAKKSFEVINAETAARRRDRARQDLATAEAELVEAIADAEVRLEALSEALARVLAISRRRYAYRQEATGKAARSLLARNTVEGWLAWRLQALELPGFDHPPHHYRAPLAELLGLAPEPTDEGDTE